jgi:ribulose-phosphate 3-epimerase
MISEPEKYINAFAEFKPEIITIHQEACPHLHRTIYQIKEKGIKAGVALNPGTSVETLVPVAEDLDMVLFMTVNPGFGGQTFIPNVLRKMEQGRALLRTYNKELLVEVDGGVNEETAKMCEYYGADILVAGSAIFGKDDYQKAINALR